MRTYNWVSLGCEVIANQLAEAMKQEGRTLYGVANRTHSKAIEFARKHHIPKIYDNIQDLFTEELVDIIYISTPHNTHIQYLQEALQHGKLPIHIRTGTSILARAVQDQPKLWRWTTSGLNCRGGISAFCCGGTWFLIYLCFLFRTGGFSFWGKSRFRPWPHKIRLSYYRRKVPVNCYLPAQQMAKPAPFQRQPEAKV